MKKARLVVFIVFVGILFFVVFGFVIFDILYLSRFVDRKNKVFHLESYRSEYLSSYGKDFKCSGSCYCLEQDEYSRKSILSSVTPTRTLLHIVTAVSVISAMNLAKNHFDERCKHHFSDTCDINAIQSNVETCQQISSSEATESTTEEEEEEEDEMGFESEEVDRFLNSLNIWEYKCVGKCLPRDDILKAYDKWQDKRDERISSAQDLLPKESKPNPIMGMYDEHIKKCATYTKELTIVLVLKDRIGDYTLERGEQEAKDKFYRDHFRAFCDTESLLSREDIVCMGLKPFSTDEYQEERFPMCTARLPSGEDGITCVRLNPK